MEIEAQTNSSGDIDSFRSALNQLEGCEKAEVIDPQSRNGVSIFRLVLTFNPDAFTATEEPPAPAPVAPETPAEPQPTQPEAEAQS